jgi:hypothetical protein
MEREVDALLLVKFRADGAQEFLGICLSRGIVNPKELKNLRSQY